MYCDCDILLDKQYMYACMVVVYIFDVEWMLTFCKINRIQKLVHASLNALKSPKPPLSSLIPMLSGRCEHLIGVSLSLAPSLFARVYVG